MSLKIEFILYQVVTESPVVNPIPILTPVPAYSVNFESNPVTTVLPDDALTKPSVTSSYGLNVRVCGLTAELYVADNLTVVAAFTGFDVIAPDKG